METSIQQLLPANVYQAAVNANSPSLANPFATMADVGGSDEWSEVLGNGNNTDGNDTVWSSGDVLRSAGISNLLATVVGPVGAGPAQDQTTLTGLTYSVHGSREATLKVGATITIAGTANNDGVHVITAAETIGIGPYKTFFQFAGIAADVAGGTVTTDNGALIIDFNFSEFYAPNEALDGYMWESNDGASGADKAWREFHPEYQQLGYGQAYHYLADGGVNNSAFTIYGSNYSFIRPFYCFNIIGENSFSASVGNTLFTKAGNMIIQENDTGNYTTGNIANYPGAFIAQNTTINQNVINSAAVGTNGAIVKTNETTYVNALAFNAGLAGEMRLVHTANAADFTATLQAASGTIAYTSDIPAGAGDNFATADLTFTANRVQDLASFNLEFDTGAGGKLRFSATPGGPPATKEMDIYVNSTAAYIHALGGATPGGTPLVIIGGEQPGVRGISLQTVSNIIEVTDATNTMIHDFAAVTGTKTATWRDLTGTVAYLTDVQTGQTYNVTNVTTDRDYDANASTVGELADVLGTLVTDLQNIGILS